jgi:hypothetical protein
VFQNGIVTERRRRELTTAAVARRLGLGRSTIIRMGDNGILEMADRSAVPLALRVRRNPRFYEDDIEAYEREGGTVADRQRGRAG